MNALQRMFARIFGYAGTEGQLVTPPEYPGFTPTPINRVAAAYAQAAPGDYNPFTSAPIEDIGGSVEPHLGRTRLAGAGRAIGAPSSAVPAERLYMSHPHRHRHHQRQGVLAKGSLIK